MYANLVNFGLLVKTVAAFGETELKKDHEKWDFKELNYSGGGIPNAQIQNPFENRMI